jgi:hypothetical protein
MPGDDCCYGPVALAGVAAGLPPELRRLISLLRRSNQNCEPMETAKAARIQPTILAGVMAGQGLAH